jgi:hypothetical protein
MMRLNKKADVGCDNAACICNTSSSPYLKFRAIVHMYKAHERKCQVDTVVTVTASEIQLLMSLLTGHTLK